MRRILNNEDFPYFIDEEGNFYSEKTNKKIKYNYDKDGYPIITFQKPIKKTYRCARLVLKTFSDVSNSKFLKVLYKDGDKKNISLSNLYWENEDVNQLTIADEEWRKIYIDGNETFYSISNYGRCRNDSKGTILKGRFNKYTGYISYVLQYRQNDKTISAHRTVMKAFCPIEHMDDLVVNHLDGDKTNNHLSNLEWCTPSQNMIHAFENNLRNPKWANQNIWIYDLDGNFIKQSIVKEFAKELGITNDFIIRALRGEAKTVKLKYQVFNENKGEKVSAWYRKTTANKVYAYTKNHEFINAFESQKECAKYFGVVPSTIGRCLKLNKLLLDEFILSKEPLT